MSRRNHRPPGELAPWSRERLLGALVGVVVCAIVVVAGIGLAVWQLVTQPDQDPAHVMGDASDGLRVLERDRIAAEPMLVVARDDAMVGAPAVSQPDPITIPEPIDLDGPAGVPTGFPRTPEGAIGQLAQIEATVLDSMSTNTARAVHAAWVRPGGPGLEEWVLTRSVQSFVRAAGSGHQTAVVKALPAAGLVKGIDGPDWVLACVLLDVHAQLRTEARVGFGHCERMTWVEGRWQIADGAPPAFAPSTLPGSQKAADAGWRLWQIAGVQR